MREHIGMEYPKFDYKEYPKTLDPNDFWGQVRRTVRGRPVSEEQIQQIVLAIRNGLSIQAPDCLLDLACGNGALSRYLFEDCTAFHGVDFSEYLISVAREHFARPPDFDFECADVVSYVRNEPNPGRFTVALCYGSFAYFSADDARTVLQVLRDRFTRVQRLLIGNLPDRDRAHAFYPPDKDYAAELDQHESQIGIWRSRAQMSDLARETGWNAEFSVMPASFYAANYRYDVVLERITKTAPDSHEHK